MEKMWKKVNKIFGNENTKTLKDYRKAVEKINALETEMQTIEDKDFSKKTAEFKTRLEDGESLDDLIPESFALVREASDRVLGLRHFDVQLIGGFILNEGKIAEMKTGEGKTIVALLPTFLNALYGKGTHVITVNDYLARRDAEYVGQVHRFLGLSVGLIQEEMEQNERKANYNCDVVYVTNNELGFDYLRDNMAFQSDELVQRPFFYCLIDEVDSVLIDEARTPLIISGANESPTEKYIKTFVLSKFARKYLQHAEIHWHSER